METFDLLAHPAHSPAAVRCVTARVLSWDANWCVLRWKVEGAGRVIVPAFAGNARTDGLWQATCFELFVAPLDSATTFTPSLTPTSKPTSVRPEPAEGHAQPQGLVSVEQASARVLRQAQDERGEDKKPDSITYSEFNFSPSERWAAYDFTAYRDGMTVRAMNRAPVITPRRGGDVLFCDVAIPSAQLPPLPWRYALTAVIVETGGTRSFWAPAHGGDRPDFHDPACLAGVLAAPVGA